jgi:deoxyribonuclease IV
MPEAQHSSILAYDATDEYRPEPSPPASLPAWMDGSLRIGIHTSIAGDIVSALDTAHGLGCNALQIFSASPRMWARTEGQLAESDAQRFRERRAALGLGPLVIHDNYLINLASPDPMLRTRSLQAFHGELVRAIQFGADYLVAHPGSSRGMTAAQAIDAVAAALQQATRGLKLEGLRILLENTSGQGSALGSRFDELRAILDACPGLPLGLCIDTAHLFEAGHDIRTAEGLERTLDVIDEKLGLERVFVFHVNDSKTPLGSRVDRHEHIGKGRIGRQAFKLLLNHARLAGRAFILETPIDRPGDDRRNVRMLWRLAGREPLPGTSRTGGFPARRRGKGHRARAAMRRKSVPAKRVRRIRRKTANYRRA